MAGKNVSEMIPILSCRDGSRIEPNPNNEGTDPSLKFGDEWDVKPWASLKLLTAGLGFFPQPS